MPIVKTVSKPNGSPVGFHRAVSAQIDYRAGTAVASVASWRDEAAYLGDKALDFMWHVAIPIARVADVDAALVELVPEFLGGTVVADAAGGVAAARVRRRAAMKDERDRRIGLAGTTAWGSFDTDAEARANLTSVAVMLMANPSVPTVRFTGADNVRRTFARADYIAAASTVGAAVQGIFDTYDTVCQAIEAASTVAQVAAVSWPA